MEENSLSIIGLIFSAGTSCSTGDDYFSLDVDLLMDSYYV